MILRVLVLAPAPFSQIETHKELRDYKIHGTNGPYGNLTEWRDYAENFGFDRIEYKTLEGELKSIPMERHK